MLKIKELSHSYANQNEKSLNNINITVDPGESVVIIGSSGSGKSTLLKCINRLVEPSEGNIIINEEDILNSKHKDVERIRGKVAMIFQNFGLIERSTVLTNVLNGRLRHNGAVSTIFGKFSNKDYEIAHKNIELVGLNKFIHKRVADLSGGQKQRVAIARALCQEPEIILADEPVSSLDPKLMKEIMDLLTEICKSKNLTLITSLHFLDFAKKYATRIIGIKEGSIIFDGEPENLTEKDIVDIYGKTKDCFDLGKIGF